jgi:hypothetical protein
MIDKAKDWVPIASAVLIALSATHVVLASIYLYFYCVGFGANMAMFFSAADIFSISITRLSNVYVQAIVLPTALVLIRRGTGIKTNDEWIEAASTPELQRRRYNSLIVPQNIGKAVVWLALLYALPVSVWRFWAGEAASAYFILSMFALLTSWQLASRGLLTAPLWIGLFFAAGVVGGGLDGGIRDRHAVYSAPESRPACKTMKVLGRASSLYVAVQPDNRKVLVKEDCSVVFSFPNPKITPWTFRPTLPDFSPRSKPAPIPATVTPVQNQSPSAKVSK